MKNLYRIILLLLVVSQACKNEEFNKLDVLFSSKYHSNMPGAAIAVVKGSQIIFRKGYGVCDLESANRITTTTNFNICSLTKQFTAYAILKLEYEKKLSLDDKIEKYFPDFNPRVASAITIRQLLSHSSGLIDHYDYADRKSGIQFSDADALNAIKSVDSVYFPAGRGYRYSNTAFCLLSQIIEKVSGSSYPQYIRENIFKPLGMDNSDVIHPDMKIPDRAAGYQNENNHFARSDARENFFFSTMGDGGIYTSVDEYLKWIMAIMNNSVLNPELISDARSPHNLIDSAKNLSYGYGWFVKGSGKNKTVFHTGSNGGFRTIVFMIPEKKYAVVVFSNQTGIDLEELVLEINKIYSTDTGNYLRLDSLIS
jgi:CubicO group peptidase (beta-lactamase class C family)